jgi:hypothetical protein
MVASPSSGLSSPPSQRGEQIKVEQAYGYFQGKAAALRGRWRHQRALLPLAVQSVFSIFTKRLKENLMQHGYAFRDRN